MGFGIHTKFLCEVSDVLKFTVRGSVEEAVDFVLELGTVQSTKKDKGTNRVAFDFAVFVAKVGNQALKAGLEVFNVGVKFPSLLDVQKCNGALLNFGGIGTAHDLDDELEQEKWIERN